MLRCSRVVVVVAFLASGTAQADVWDNPSSTDHDNSSLTDNELIHGSNQIHDLGVLPGSIPDEDWFTIGQKPRSSYEIVVDATGGDIGFSTNLLQRVDAAGTGIFQIAASVTPTLDTSRSLRWANTASATVVNEYIRVGPGICGTACTAVDQYHIRAMETTIYVARYNNTGTQSTTLLAQNASEVTVTGTVFYWNAAGALVGQSGLLLGAKQVAAISTSEIPGVAGTSGSITIAHDAPYGQLNVKAVGLEPSTGFTFDTPGVYRGF